jgi:hypothetical protein
MDEENQSSVGPMNMNSKSSDFQLKSWWIDARFWPPHGCSRACKVATASLLHVFGSKILSPSRFSPFPCLPFLVALSDEQAAPLTTAARTHHCASIHQITPIALPSPHEPRQPLCWSSRAQGKWHCRLFPARSSPEHHRLHGPPWLARHWALPSHLIPVSYSPSRLDAMAKMSPSELVRSRRNTAAHRHDMAATGARTRPCSSTSPSP